MKSFRRLLSSVLLLCMVFSLSCSFACAASDAREDQRSSQYLSNYGAWMGNDGGGQVYVGVTVTAKNIFPQVGAQDIYIYEGTAPSGPFSQVAHYNYSSYPDMMTSGSNYFDAPVTYNGTVGYYYMAVVIVYAGDNYGYDTRTVYTTSIQATANPG